MDRSKLHVLRVLLFAAALLFVRSAHAQQLTFHLDRLELGGSPDDGIAMWRPVTEDKPLFFAQVGLGYSLNPLHTANITNVQSIVNGSSAGVIQGQFTQYSLIGFELFDRFILAASIPITWGQWGTNACYAANPPCPVGAFGASANFDTVDTSGPAAGDTRIDLRGVVIRSRDRRAALGAQVSLFAPTGSQTNFGGDGATSFMFGFTGEYTFAVGHYFDIIGDLSTSILFRPENTINTPGTNGNGGLGVGDEWRWAIAGFVPLKDDKYRLGLTIFGSTGIADDNIVGNTFFSHNNTPLEWQAEGRMRLAEYNRFWIGAGAGSRLDQSYGAPDFRLVALAGIQVPLVSPDIPSPTGKLAHRNKQPHELIDSDHDGIPDDIDACPNEPEDHLDPDPNDGCPQPPDRDHDGIPDQFDKCPDQPEDHKGSAPDDGCPDIDTDHDGIPDAVDACPHEPGKPSPDPKKNGCPQFIKLEGSSVRVLQQVHFKTGSAEILPDSFPMLQEIVDLLKATPSIQRMSIEGHTDNRGAPDMNLRLSQARANSVMAWIVGHGIAQGRLEAHGYGLTRPIADNNTDEGRLSNRRVEFHILSEGGGAASGGNKSGVPPAAPPAENKKTDVEL